ncbi:MAG TPA: hypothetical protein VH437_18745 [Terriglobales bacterium]|jgi:hypothetical protein
MKKRLLGFVALGLLTATVSVAAQDVNLRANVPFDFIVNQKVMPKGEYIVKSAGALGTQAISITAADASAQSMLISHSCESKQAADQPKLVFHRYGDSYFLSQVWNDGDTSGLEFAKSRRESELAKRSSANDVSIAALR